MIWSATPYCGEANVLEIRLGTLDQVVDRHVIIEGNLTQHGQPKPWYFQDQNHRFDRWKHKITYLRVALGAGEGERCDWQRERGLRDGLMDGLRDLQPEDLVLFSDVDEIPYPEALVDYGEPIRLQLDMHLYYLNWRWPERPVSYGARATVLSGDRISGMPSLIVEADWPLSGGAGWHLAYQGDSQAIRRKILSIADDFRRPHFLDLEHIERCRQTGADLFGRDHQCDWCPDEELPSYVLENRERFAHMLIPEPIEEAA